MKTCIRRAHRDEADAIEAILLDTYRAVWEPRLAPDVALARARDNTMGAYVAERLGHLWVAQRESEGEGEPGRELVGVVDWNGNFLDALHVSTRAQGHGVGSLLLRHAEAEIARAGEEKVRLETDTFNVQSRAFYAKHGYIEIAEYPDEEWHSGFTTVLLEKRLLEERLEPAR